MAVAGLHHAVLYVTDAERSARFYSQALGLERLPYSVSAAVFMRAPDSTSDHDLGLFSLGEGAAPTRAGSGQAGLYHLAWEVRTLDELEEVAARLTELGALVGASDHWSTKSLYAKDPDGIEFEVAWVVPPERLAGSSARLAVAPLDLAGEKERYGGDTRRDRTRPYVLAPAGDA